jgi:diguanylate cyclase (GGDEF)-like protein/PAS domain S-box-containing protein
MPRSRTTMAYLLVSVLAIVGYFLLGTSLPVVASVAYVGMSAMPLIALALGLRIYRPHDRRPWMVLAAAQGAFLVADVLWYSIALTNPSALDGPTLADAFYLAGYPLMALGLLMFIRARQPHYRATAAIDAILVGVASVLVLWIVVIDGVIHDETIPLFERLVNVAYPVCDAMVIAVAVYLLLTGRHGRSAVYLLVASLVALLMGDVIEMIGVSGTQIPSPADFFWLGSYVLFGLAALHPEMRDLSEPADVPLAPEGAGRLLLIGSAIAVLPAFALYQKFFTDHVDFGLIGITGAVTIVAILIRMHELGAVLGRSQRRYASLLANASDAFAVVTDDGEFSYVSPASERVLGYPIKETVSRSALELVHPRARARAAAVLQRVAATPGAVEELEVPVRRADGKWRWLSVTVTDRTDDPNVDGIVLNYRDITERKRLEQRLERQAFTDGLTGLANRPLFVDRLEHVLARRRRSGAAQAPISVLFLDVDDFKTVNDSLGHAAGDKLLVALGERLRATLRPADTAARLGGDEFAVLLESASETEARGVATRLLATVAEPVRINELNVSVSVSIGIAVNVPDSATVTADELLRDADLAMYTAKSRAPGTFAVYDPSMHAEAMRRLERKAGTEVATVENRRRPTTSWEPIASAT